MNTKLKGLKNLIKTISRMFGVENQSGRMLAHENSRTMKTWENDASPCLHALRGMQGEPFRCQPYPPYYRNTLSFHHLPAHYIPTCGSRKLCMFHFEEVQYMRSKKISPLWKNTCYNWCNHKYMVSSTCSILCVYWHVPSHVHVIAVNP